jgi:hypothetical protein
MKPTGPALDMFDALYAGVVTLLNGQRQVADEAIVAFLDSCWPGWVEGIRDRHIS